MQEVGYENITYFYKIFKEKFKITPSIYRNHNLR
ncbi:AraC family transcriptional regulator [Erysipelatoclostridium ramosum]|nr:AraC family transcriptional regulator [Thomasclavelia ramosa]MDB7039042.1 AraC family transcriptional regulator [Thomasclavelia ramosa]